MDFNSDHCAPLSNAMCKALANARWLKKVENDAQISYGDARISLQLLVSEAFRFDRASHPEVPLSEAIQKWSTVMRVVRETAAASGFQSSINAVYSLYMWNDDALIPPSPMLLRKVALGREQRKRELLARLPCGRLFLNDPVVGVTEAQQ